jgi:hypothetical protein
MAALRASDETVIAKGPDEKHGNVKGQQSQSKDQQP